MVLVFCLPLKVGGSHKLLIYSLILLRSTQTLTFPLLLGVTSMGSYQSISWSTMDMTPVSYILSNSSLNLSDRAVGFCLWNSHLERFCILFECENGAFLHDAQSNEQLRLFVWYISLVVITAEAAESASDAKLGPFLTELCLNFL